MKLRHKWLTIIFAAVLTIVAALMWTRPIMADTTPTTATVTQTTNQANAPNAASQNTTLASDKQATSTTTSSTSSTSATTADSTATNINGTNTNIGETSTSKTTAVTSADSNNTASDSTSSNTADSQTNSSATSSNTGNSATANTLAASQVVLASQDSQNSQPDFSVRVNQQVTPTSTSVTLDTTTVNQYTGITFTLNYDFTGQNVFAGNYFDFTFPSALEASIGNSSFSTNQGTVTISGNTGRFTFNEGMVGSDAKGNFYLTLRVKSDQTSGDIPFNVTVNGEQVASSTIHFIPQQNNANELFSKYTMNNDLTKGNVEYALRINPTGTYAYNDAVISDHLSTPGFTYDQSSFKIYHVQWTWDGNDWQNTTINQITDITPTFSDNDTSFQINFGDRITNDGTGYLVLYELLFNGQPVNQTTDITQQPASGTIIRNTASLSSSNHSTITYPQTLVIANSGGHGVARTFEIEVTKTDEGGQTKLEGATFQLLKDNKVVGTATTDSNGVAKFTGLVRGTYTLHETAAPTGYQLAADQTITIPADQVDNLKYVTVEDTPVTTSMTVTKVWNDNNNQDGLRPSSVTVNLLNGQTVVKIVTLNAANNWTATVNDLPEYSNGKLINYTWSEVSVANYTASQSVNGTTTTITNTHTPATMLA